jgi:single-strand DNA-binding protein
MAVDLNHLTLSGCLTRDPVLETLPSGKVVCDLRVACAYRSRDESTGAWRDWTDRLPVRAFGYQARTAADHLRKGRRVAIVGRLSTRRICEPGAEPRWTVEVVAQTIQFAERPA